MAIPEEQLEIWSHIGAITTSASTYATVRQALELPTSGFANRSKEVFLQGSYGNNTNIRAESDVDVVIRLDSVFQYDISGLPQDQMAAFSATHGNSAYGHAQYKADVLSVLTQQFGNDVVDGPKAVTISARGNRRKADVLVATQFRKYSRYINGTEGEFVRGVSFFNSENRRIANYPKQHSDNATAKHQATNGRYKPMVRIFKNIRERLYADGLLAAKSAPSYFIEGLLYNVPDADFAGSLSDSFVACFNHVHSADRSQFACVNLQHWLIRPNEPTSWNADNCEAFLQAARELWNNW